MEVATKVAEAATTAVAAAAALLLLLLTLLLLWIFDFLFNPKNFPKLLYSSDPPKEN